MSGDGQVVASVPADVTDTGNTASTSNDNSVTYDGTAPDTTITEPENDTLTNNPQPEVTFESDDSSADFECRVDLATFAECTSPFTPQALGDGSHTVDVRAVDPVGNTDATPASINLMVDTTAPDVALDSTPDSLTNNATPTFTFSSTDDEATFECKLDDGDYVTCTSPHMTAELDDGAHTFSVRAVDLAENRTAIPESSHFTVDTTPPDTQLDSTPDALTNDATPTFSFSSADDEAAFECKLDDGEFADCESPYTTGTLTNGAHTFSVRAVDVVGNADATSASHNFSVDTVAPTVSISGGATDPTNATPITVTITFSEVVSGLSAGEIVVGNGSRGALASDDDQTYSIDISPSIDGEVTVNVPADVATDAAGNSNTAAASAYSVTYDSSAPDTAITTPTNGGLTTAQPAFSFGSADGTARFECALDDGDYAGCASPFTPESPLSEGEHSFSVRATDAAGNTDTTPASVTFTVDTTAPDVSLDTTPPSLTNDATPTFAFSSTDGEATFECKLDDGEYVTCASPHTTGTLTDGAYTFSVRAVDPAGNRSSIPATHSVTVDTLAPETTITAPVGTTVTNDTTPSFSFSSADGSATFECRLGDGEFAACTSPYTTGALADGAVTFAVRAVDAADNADTTPASVTVTVDTTAPDTQLDSAPEATTSDTTPTFAFSSPDDSATFECKLDDGAFAACTSPHTTGTLAESAHSFSVRAVDAAGNVDATPESVTFSVDGSAPDTQLDSKPDATTNDTTPTFEFSSVDSDVSYECKLDDGEFAACTSPHTTAELADGLHTFAVRAVDSANNADPSPASAAFTVDTVAPTVTGVTRVTTSPTNRDSLDFEVHFSENVSGISNDAFALDATGITGASLTGVTGSSDRYTVTVSTGSGDGTLRLDVRAEAPISDAAGNLLAGGYSDGESYSLIRAALLVDQIDFEADGGTLTFTVSFSAPVSGVDMTDFTLDADGIDGQIDSVDGTDAVYTVTVTYSGVGTLALTVLDDDTIVDGAGNTLAAGVTGPTFDNRPDKDENDDHDDDQDDTNDLASASATPAPVATPPPAPLLADFDGSTNDGVRARVPDGAYGIYGRVLAMDGAFVVDPAQIGSAEVLSRPVLAAVDVFSPNGGSAGHTQICLRGSGDVLFLDATTSPRQLLQLPATVEAGMTCVMLPANGTVVLVGS